MSKKIEFELIVQTSTADNAVLGVEKKIVSLTSNLKESLNRLEVLKKALETTGNKIPALDLIKKFQQELATASKSVSSVQDVEAKALLKQYLQQAKQTNLPLKLSNLVQSAPKQGIPLGVGELTGKQLEQLGKTYASVFPKATPTVSKSFEKSLEESLKKNSILFQRTGDAPAVSKGIPQILGLYLQDEKRKQSAYMVDKLSSYLKAQTAKSPSQSEILGKSLTETLSKFAQDGASSGKAMNVAAGVNSVLRQAVDRVDILRKSFNSALGEAQAKIANFKEVKAFQSPIVRQREEYTERFAKLNNFKGLTALSSIADNSNLNSKEQEEKLFQKYKPLTFVQREQEKIAALQDRLTKIKPNGYLTEFWAKTALAIKEAEEALQKYQRTEDSLRFQRGLNQAVLPFGQQQLALAKFNTLGAGVNGNLSARIAQEGEQTLAKVEKRFNNLIQRTASKIDGTTTDKQRKSLLQEMVLLGQNAAREFDAVKGQNAARALTASYKDELYALKEQSSIKSEIKKKDEEILALMRQVSRLSLAPNIARDMLTELQKAKQALQDLDKEQRRLNSVSSRNQLLKNSTQKQLTLVDQRQSVLNSLVPSGKVTVETISIIEQQRLETLRSRIDATLNRKTSALNSSTTVAQREAIAKSIEKTIAYYKQETQAILANGVAARSRVTKREESGQTLDSLKVISASYAEQIAALRTINPLQAERKKRSQEILEIQNKINAAGYNTTQLRSLNAELTNAKKTLQEFNSLQIEQRRNSLRNQEFISSGSGLLSGVEQKQKLSIVQGKYGVNSLQAINLQEQQKLAELRAEAENKIARVNRVLTPNTSDSVRNILQQRVEAIGRAYDQSTGAIVRQSSALRANSLAIQAHLSASNNLLVRISEYVIGYRLVNSAVDAFTGFLRNIPDAGIKLENTKAVFQAMFVTTKDVNEQFQFIEVIADRTGGRLRTLRTEFADFSASAIAAGESTKNVQQTFADLADVSTVLHLPEEKVHGALVAISQMYAKNQVMAEELKRQLGNVLPGSVAMFARSQNLTTKELLDAMKLGQIRPKDTVPQFLKFYKEVFAPEDAFKTASQGFNATIGRFQNEYTRLSEGVYKEVSSNLIGFTKTATGGLTLVRENLDGILTVLRDIGLVAGIAGSAALFRMGAGRLARSAITNDASRAITANAANPLSAQIRVPSVSNNSDLLAYAALSQLLPNLINVVKTSIGTLSPVVKVATAALIAFELAWNKLEGIPVLNLKAEVELSSLDLYIDRANKAIGRFKELQALSTNEARLNEYDFKQKLGIKDSGIAEGLGNFFDNLFKARATAQEKAYYESKALREKELKEEKAFRESLILEGQKRLLAEPTSLMENAFDPKVWTRTIDLLGKAVTTQIASVSARAQMEIGNIDQKISKLQKLASHNLISPGQVLRATLEANKEKNTIAQQALSTKLELGLRPIEVANQLSARTELLAEVNKKIATFEDRDSVFKVLNAGRASIPTLDDKGVAGEKNFYNLGRVFNSDLTKGKVLTLEQEQEEIKKIQKSREEFLNFLSAETRITAGKLASATTEEQAKLYKEHLDVLTKTKPPFLYLPETETDTNYRENSKQLDLITAERDKMMESIQQLSFSMEAFAAKTDYANTQTSSTILDYIPKTIKEGFDKNATIFKRQLGVETRGVAEAQKATVVSPKGAIGYGQILPSTAADPGFNVPTIFELAKKAGIAFADKSLDESARLLTVPELNKEFGLLYSKALRAKYGDRLGVAAYNAGANNVEKYNGMPPFKETIDYDKRVFGSQGQPFEYYLKQTTENIKALPDKIQTTQDLSKPFRIPGATAVSRSFAGQNLIEETNLARQQQEISYQQANDNATVDFMLAKLDKQLALKNEISVPYAKAANPLSFEPIRQELENAFEPTLNFLKADKATPRLEDRVVGDDKTIDALIEQHKQTVLLQKRLFDLGREETLFSLSKEALNISQQKERNTFAFQASSPISQAFQTSSMAKASLAQAQAGQQAQFTRWEQDPNLLPEDLANKKAQYLADLENLKKETEGLGNYFRTTLSQNMQQPIKDFVMQTTSAEEALKAFGTNVLSNLADNIIQELSTAVSDMLVQAGAKAAASSFFSTAMSAFGYASGGKVQGFATGGSIGVSQIISRTQRVRGEGTSTSDSIPAIVPIGSYVLNAEAAKRVNLSNGEIVISPREVDKIGVDNLNHINFGGNYSSGGQVGGRASSSPSSSVRKEGDIFHITIENSSSGDPAKEGEKMAVAMMEKIAEIKAKQVVNQSMAIHAKTSHRKA